jgi:hypothetical protein
MRARTVAMLVAGRGAARLAQYGAGIALLAIWGPTEFARYAAATGVALWLFSLSASGVERAALISVDGPRREALFAWFALFPFAVTILAYAATAAFAPPGVAGYAAGFAFMSGTGSATVLVGLFRLRGRPGADATAFLALSAGYAGAVLLAAFGRATVDGVLGALVALVVVINLALLAALRPTIHSGLGWPEVGRGARTVLLLAAGDVLSGAAVSVVYAQLAARAPAEQSSVMYVCLLVSTALGIVSNYILRLWQPNILAWLARAPEAARVRIRQCVTAATVIGAATTLAATVAVLAWGAATAATVVALTAEIVTFVAMASGAFLVESLDDRARLRSAASALVGLGVVAVVGWVLAPVGGAAGTLVALAAGWAARGPVLQRGLTAPTLAGTPTGSSVPSPRP